MKFLTLFKRILILNCFIFSANANNILEFTSNRYERMLNRSIKYMKFFFNTLMNLEELKEITEELIFSIDKQVRKLERLKEDIKSKGIEDIIDRITKLIDILKKQVKEAEEQLSSDNANFNLNDLKNKVKIGDYKNTIQNLVILYGYMITLTAKIYTVKDKTEQHIENIARDIANLDTTMQYKEKTTNNIYQAIVTLTKELNALTKVTLKEIINCKKQVEDINKNNKEFLTKKEKSKDNKKKETSTKDTTSNSKQDNEDQEKTSGKEKKANSKNKDKSEIKNNKDEESKNKKDKSNTDKKNEKTKSNDNTSAPTESDDDSKKNYKELTLDDITDEEIIEYVRSKANNAKNTETELNNDPKEKENNAKKNKDIEEETNKEEKKKDNKANKSK